MEVEERKQLALADALWALGQDRPRARKLADEVRASHERLDHRPGLAQVTGWLAQHPSAAISSPP